MKIYLDPQVAKALLGIAAKTDTRYYLNGLHIEPLDTGAAVVATNDAILAAVRVIMEDGPGHPFIVPREAIEHMTLAKKAPDICIERTDGDITITQGDRLVRVAPVDGSYPDWRRVVPSDTSGESAVFDPDLLAKLGALNKALGGRYLGVSYNGTGGARVTFGGEGAGGHAVGVIMPIRPDCVPIEDAPAWAVHS